MAQVIFKRPWFCNGRHYKAHLHHSQEVPDHLVELLPSSAVVVEKKVVEEEPEQGSFALGELDPLTLHSGKRKK